MSAGFLIYLFGHKRYMGEHATLMYHDVATFAHGKSEYVKQELSEVKRLANMMNQLIINTSKVGLKTLEDYINRKAEWYIDLATALDLELCDGYY